MSAEAVAGIPPERQGKARLAGLSPAERELYRWILERFARAGRPEVDALCDEASRLGLQIEPALATLARRDLVHHDPATGEIVVAYPFSGRPRGYQVLIDGTQLVEAMCAIDALGIAPMLGLPIEVTSRDPADGAEVWVRLDPGDGIWWEPTEAVVLVGSGGCGGPSYRACCETLHFFASGENAERYLRDQTELTGFVLAIPEAAELGRAVFGDLFEEG